MKASAGLACNGHDDGYEMKGSEPVIKAFYCGLPLK